MSDVHFSAVDCRSEPTSSHGSKDSNERALVMRPKSFFSHRFDLYVEGHDTEERPSRPLPVFRNGPDRLIDLNLLLMILLIGVPVLAYCILSTAN